MSEVQSDGISENGRQPRKVARVTADLPTRDTELLARLAERSGFNKVTTLVRAIRVLGVLEDAKADGGRVEIVDTNGGRRELLLP